jgi:hypothetical protein
VNVSFENNLGFGFQERGFRALRLDYMASKDFIFGLSSSKLSERPFFTKTNFGSDPINNSMYGFDFNYKTELPKLTKALDKLPFYSTKTKSYLTAYGEGAFLQPGHARQIGRGGNGVVYLDDFEAGFYLRNPTPGDVIQISLFSDYILPNFSTLDELVQILNNSDHPGIKLFNYEIINGRQSDNQYIIHAQANYLSKEMYHILNISGAGSPASPTSPGIGSGLRGDKYTFFLPKKVFSKPLIDYMKSLSPVFDDETMFLLAKTSDVLSGAVQDPGFWRDERYWKFVNDEQIGYLPTTIDQNAFNITDIKLYEETFTVPENGIIFFVINNLDGKSDFIWKLTNVVTGEEIVKAKSVPFFVWKFKDLGNFTLSVEVFDNRNTRYVSEIQNFIQVLDKKQYIGRIETRLNDRKRRLLKSRV